MSVQLLLIYSIEIISPEQVYEMSAKVQPETGKTCSYGKYMAADSYLVILTEYNDETSFWNINNQISVPTIQ